MMAESVGHAKITGALVCGAEGKPVEVEISIEEGIPGIWAGGDHLGVSMSGIVAAIRSCGFEVPRGRVAVDVARGRSLACGAPLDLAIACGILIASGQVPGSVAEGRVLVGDLAPDGRVLPARGAAAIQIGCGGAEVIAGTGSEVSRHFGAVGLVRSLADLIAGGIERPGEDPREGAALLDFSDVPGCPAAKWALSVAVTARVGAVLVGSDPGIARTLAQCVPGIMPAMSDDEIEESASALSAAGESIGGVLAGTRPFVPVGPSVSLAGIAGGGRPVRPGAASLATRGVLFLDDLGGFKANQLALLRAPIEDGECRIARADGIYRMPSHALPVGYAWPCPCGSFGSHRRECRCTAVEIARYLEALHRSCDRIMPIWIRVDEWDDGRTQGSSEVRERIAAALPVMGREGAVRGFSMKGRIARAIAALEGRDAEPDARHVALAEAIMVTRP